MIRQLIMTIINNSSILSILLFLRLWQLYPVSHVRILKIIFNSLFYMTQPKSFLDWAYNRSDNRHPKYNTLAHALTISVKHTIVFVLTSLAIRYYFYPSHLHDQDFQYQLQPGASYVGVFLLIYLFVMISTRFHENGPIALYESIWACNQCILLAGIGCLTNDCLLIRTVLITISVDQLLWYFDLAGFIVKKKFYIGVAKYIIWPQTSRVRLATTFHHVWFLPLCLWIVHPTAKYTTFSAQVFILSCVFSLILALLGRITTPKQIIVQKQGKQVKTVYMNINLSWELWKDVKIGFIQYLYKIVPRQFTVVVLSLCWDLGNMPGFLLFWGLESLTA